MGWENLFNLMLNANMAEEKITPCKHYISERLALHNAHILGECSKHWKSQILQPWSSSRHHLPFHSSIPTIEQTIHTISYVNYFNMSTGEGKCQLSYGLEDNFYSKDIVCVSLVFGGAFIEIPISSFDSWEEYVFFWFQISTVWPQPVTWYNVCLHFFICIDTSISLPVGKEIDGVDLAWLG